MTAEGTRDLVEGLLGVLTDTMTGAGHAAQVVPWEHRGNCPVTGCTDRCRTYRDLLVRATDFLGYRQPEASEAAG